MGAMEPWGFHRTWIRKVRQKMGWLWTPLERVHEQTHGHERLDTTDQLTWRQVVDQYQDAQGPEGTPLSQSVPH